MWFSKVSWLSCEFSFWLKHSIKKRVEYVYPVKPLKVVMFFFDRFIEFCQDNNSCKGTSFQMPDVEDETLVAQMTTLNLNRDEAFQAGEEDLSRTDYEGQPWRRDDS